MDILLISETRIDTSFPTEQFLINGFTAYRRGRNRNDRVMLLYIRENIPSKLLHTDDIKEGFYIEISIITQKLLLGCSYNPHKRFISSSLKELGKNFTLLGDLNVEPTNEAKNDFCRAYDCSNIIKKALVSKIRKTLPALI